MSDLDEELKDIVWSAAMGIALWIGVLVVLVAILAGILAIWRAL